MSPRTVALRGSVAVLALLLLWRIVHVNAVLYGDDGRPLARIAPDLAAPAGAAAEALRENPADFRALLVIAGARERAADLQAAARGYEIARGIAPIDLEVLQASAGFALRQGRIAEGLGHLSGLAQHYPETRERIFPLLVQLLSSAPHAAAIATLADSDPGWLGGFIVFACARDVDPGVLVPFLLRRVSLGTARTEESSCITERLRTAGRWDSAYQVWLNTLPRERMADVGNVFNGSFEHVPSGIGFDWVTSRAASYVVEYPAASGVTGQRALRVTYNGKRQAGPAIRQFLAVPPGRYELSGRARPEGLQSVRGLRWAVRCALTAGGATLGVSERFIGSSEWLRFGFEVVVPDSCPGQVLELEPVGIGEGTTYLAGKAWFDDLRLTRIR